MAPIDVTAITFSELRYVAALAELRHFGRAAAACHVTQPTLSAQVKKLEGTLRVRLFERTSKSVVPTAIGLAIAAQARAILDAMDRIADLADSDRAPLAGPLRLGVIPTIGPYLLPWLVPPLRVSFPKLELILREVKTADMLDEIARFQLDAGMLALPVAGSHLATAPLFEEPFWLVAPAGHALRKKKFVSEADLEGERVLLLDEGHCLREQALAVCRHAGADTNELGGDFRATSIETLRHMVAAGMGLTLVPALALRPDEEAREDIVLRQFTKPGPSRKMALAWRKTHPRASDFVRLAELVRAHAPASVSVAG